jgi:phosphonate transport system substrate-binding protein
MHNGNNEISGIALYASSAYSTAFALVEQRRGLAEQLKRIYQMKFSMKLATVALAWMCSVACATPLYQTSYNFSPVNQYNLQLTASFWNPIIEYVSTKSGVHLNLKLGRTSADTTSYVLAKEVDFAFTNHLFSPERVKLGWKVFGRRDAPPVRAQIVVPSDSPIATLSNLAGKNVAFPGPEAMIAYKAPYAQLLKEAIPVNIFFAGNQDAAFSQLYSGRVAAIGVNSQLAEGYAKREGKSLRILWSSEPFNELALMVSPRVPEQQAQAVAAAFFSMDQDAHGREILQRVGKLVGLPSMARFVPARDDDYQSYRDFFEVAPLSLR